jgi:tetratricopeptide (TPR) repeat protein
MFKKILAALALVVFIAGCASTGKKSVKNQEKDPQYQYEKAVISFRYGLEDEALKYLDLALALDPAHAPSLLLLGNIQYKKEKYGEAAATYQKYLELGPNDAEAHTSLGLTYSQLGMPDKTEAEYQKALAIDGHANAAFGLAKLYYDQNKLEPALDLVQKAIQKNSKSPAYYNLKGVILNQMHRYAEALPCFQAALQYAPDDIYVTINLGIAYINIKEFAKARAILEGVLPKIQDEALKSKVNEYLKLIKENS